MSAGTLNILNVGTGDTKIVFDKNNPAESIRAGRIIKDMLRRGYALLVEVERNGEKAFERATGFDEQTNEYIIADFDPISAQEADMEEGAEQLRRRREQADGQASANEAGGSPDVGTQGGEVPEQAPKRGRGRPSGRVPATGTRAVGVARSAGG